MTARAKAQSSVDRRDKIINAICGWLGFDYSPITGEPLYVVTEPTDNAALEAFDREIMVEFIRENLLAQYQAHP